MKLMLCNLGQQKPTCSSAVTFTFNIDNVVSSRPFFSFTRPSWRSLRADCQDERCAGASDHALVISFSTSLQQKTFAYSLKNKLPSREAAYNEMWTCCNSSCCSWPLHVYEWLPSSVADVQVDSCLLLHIRKC